MHAEAAPADASGGKGKGRTVKTPLQKEVLEAIYQGVPSLSLVVGAVPVLQPGILDDSPDCSDVLAVAEEANPTQQHRKAIAERLDLTEEQVQVCARSVCSSSNASAGWTTCQLQMEEEARVPLPSLSHLQCSTCAGCGWCRRGHSVGWWALCSAALQLHSPALATPPVMWHATSPCVLPCMLQAWFVARRRKDKKKDTATSEAGTGADGGAVSDAAGAEDASGPGGGLPAADAAQAELLELAKGYLPVPFREDGPQLVCSLLQGQFCGSSGAAELCNIWQLLAVQWMFHRPHDWAPAAEVGHSTVTGHAQLCPFLTGL